MVYIVLLAPSCHVDLAIRVFVPRSPPPRLPSVTLPHTRRGTQPFPYHGHRTGHRSKTPPGAQQPDGRAGGDGPRRRPHRQPLPPHPPPEGEPRPGAIPLPPPAALSVVMPSPSLPPPYRWSCHPPPKSGGGGGRPLPPHLIPNPHRRGEGRPPGSPSRRPGCGRWRRGCGETAGWRSSTSSTTRWTSPLPSPGGGGGGGSTSGRMEGPSPQDHLIPTANLSAR